MRLLPSLVLIMLSAGTACAEDCSNAPDQATMSECAGKAFQKADADLNATYRQIQQRLKDDADTSKLLVTAQRAWVAFRDAQCTFTTSGAAGGTIRPMLDAMCREDLTAKRTADLKLFLACAEGDLSCPVPSK